MRGLTVFLLLLLRRALVLGVESSSPRAITSCKELPFPEACYALHGQDLRHSTFLAASRRIQQATAAARAFSTRSFRPRAMAAWEDCLELFESITSQLRMCLSAAASSSAAAADDSQTWFSGALASLETCRNGFLDFHQISILNSSPFMSPEFNVSKLLHNCLAINRDGYTAPPSRRLSSSSGFPKWVTHADRRLLQAVAPKADLVVAKDKSGNYQTIREALAAAQTIRGGSTSTRFVIYVKAGVYNENVEVTSVMKNLFIFGDGIEKTIVSGRRNVVDGSTTFRSATFATVGERFIARDMTFENTAGPQKRQAVALRSGADFSVFYRCSFKGYQDTLYVHSLRQFYRDCDVYGTIDFIFGDAAVVLQNCNIYCRRPMTGQKNVITAQGRSDPNENTGISIHNSRIAAASSDLGSVKSYLGRPWRQYSRTVVMKTNIGGLIDPAGWLEWSGDFALNTLYYAEHANTGPGAATGGRVKWKGYRGVISAAEAGKFTVGSFISGNSWLASTGVPFTSGL